MEARWTYNQISNLTWSGHREWLETDGLGGYAASTISGALTRRYHGLLVAPVPELKQRMVLVSRFEESISDKHGQRWELSTNFYPDAVWPEGYKLCDEFSLMLYPSWIYRCGDTLVKKSILMLKGEHTTLIKFELINSDTTLKLNLRPLIAARPIHALTCANDAIHSSGSFNASSGQLVLKPYVGVPGFAIQMPRSSYTADGEWYRAFQYPRDQERGFPGQEDLYCSGTFTCDLRAGQPCVVLLSTGVKPQADPAALFAREHKRREQRYGRATTDTERLMMRARDQFVITPAQGGTAIVAGYPWFECWGRDAMISLSGLLLKDGEFVIARGVLSSSLKLITNGLLPNLITDAGEKLLNSVDAVLWLFIALHRYWKASDDTRFIVTEALPVLRSIVATLREGTLFEIRVADDGLLAAGNDSVQLTWMDAKLHGHPVTPRHGKAIEINALWFNALHILANFEELSSKLPALALRSQAHAVAQRAQELFWNPSQGCLYDVVDGNGVPDGSVRPNQLFALGLPYPLISGPRAATTLQKVEQELLTGCGLRTLSPRDARYQGRYSGTPEQRDAAYHQGTVWPWLMGIYIDAVHAVRGEAKLEIERAQARLEELLTDGCIGSIGEIYDGDPPHRVEGCYAQAWSVAEMSRVLSP